MVNRTLQQNKMLQSICDALSKQLRWHGFALSKDEWRWLICAAVLRLKIVPGIPLGDGAPGVVSLGGSSRALSVAQGTEAIRLGLHIGDAPWEYDASQNVAVSWPDSVLYGDGYSAAAIEELRK